MIRFSFNLITLKNEFESINGEKESYEYKSHGGRILLFYMIIIFIFNTYNKINFVFWKHFGIGIILAIIWDIITAYLFTVKMKKIDKKKKKEFQNMCKKHDKIINDEINYIFNDLEINIFNKNFSSDHIFYIEFKKAREAYNNNDIYLSYKYLKEIYDVCYKDISILSRDDSYSIFYLMENLVNRYDEILNKKYIDNNTNNIDKIDLLYLTCENKIFLNNNDDFLFFKFKTSRMAYNEGDIQIALAIIKTIYDLMSIDSLNSNNDISIINILIEEIKNKNY